MPAYDIWVEYWQELKKQDVLGGERIKVIAPRSEVALPFEFDEETIQKEEVFDSVALEFTDSAGRHWKRDARGRLNGLRKRSI